MAATVSAELIDSRNLTEPQLEARTTDIILLSQAERVFHESSGTDEGLSHAIPQVDNPANRLRWGGRIRWSAPLSAPANAEMPVSIIMAFAHAEGTPAHPTDESEKSHDPATYTSNAVGMLILRSIGVDPDFDAAPLARRVLGHNGIVVPRFQRSRAFLQLLQTAAEVLDPTDMFVGDIHVANPSVMPQIYDRLGFRTQQRAFDPRWHDDPQIRGRYISAKALRARLGQFVGQPNS